MKLFYQINRSTMGFVDTIWVLIVSTIPSLNVPKLTRVFRYLSSLQFIIYLIFSFDFEADGLLSKLSNEPNVQTVPRSENYDLTTSSQIDVASQRLILKFGR